MLGRTISLYLMDGDASGRWKAGISQWSGHVYKIPREYLKKSEDISELSTPGVYFLFGDDNETGQNFIYVGEADNALKRIMQPHTFERDGSHWEDAVIYVSPDGSLEKGRVKYLENHFFTLASDAKRYVVKNGNTPTQSQIRPEVIDSLMYAVENIKLIMPTLGYKVFESAKRSIPAQSSSPHSVAPSSGTYSANEPTLLHLAGKKAQAKGYLKDDGSFVVLKGSAFCSEETKSCQGFLKKRRAELLNLKQVVNGKFTQDVEFNSSSSAAGCILGASVNGKVKWLYPDGTTLKDRIG